MHKFPLLAALALSAASASASVLIDDFRIASPSVTTSLGVVEGGKVALGGGVFRTLTTGVESNSAPQTGRAWSSVSGAYAFNSHATVDGWSQIDYRFETMDLRGLTAFEIDLGAGSSSLSLALTLGDATTDAMLFPMQVDAVSVATILRFEVPESFASDLDLAHVTNLGVWIDTDKGGHVGLGAIRAVPEPASVACLLIGALGVRRRRS